MTTPATPSGPAAGDDRNLVNADATALAPSLEEKLQAFWDKNKVTILAVVVIILAAIAGKGGWDWVQADKDHGIQLEYANASTADKLKAFAAAHPDHPLAGAAELRNADEAFGAGKFAEAATGYESAAAKLKGTAFAARAQLGRAMAQVLGGKTAEGEAALKALANDEAQVKGVRVEAGYQLASLAAAAGRADEVVKLSDKLMALDPSSSWTQRAVALRATLPLPAAAAEAAPTGIQIKVPGK